MSELIPLNLMAAQPGGSMHPGGAAERASTPEHAGSGSVGGAGDDKERQALKNACSEFEALFMNYMLKEMRNTVPKSGLLSGGKAEELYTSMLDTQMAREISQKRSIGLSSFFMGQLEEKQGPDTNPFKLENHDENRSKR